MATCTMSASCHHLPSAGPGNAAFSNGEDITEVARQPNTRHARGRDITLGLSSEPSSSVPYLHIVASHAISLEDKVYQELDPLRSSCACFSIATELHTPLGHLKASQVSSARGQSRRAARMYASEAYLK